MKKHFTLLIIFTLSSVICYSQGDEELLISDIDYYVYSPNKKRAKSKFYYEKLKDMVASGNSEAMYYLGIYQKNGIGTKQNLNKSRKSFELAYQSGSSNAAFCLGYYYLKGLGGLTQNYKEAYKLFELSGLPIARHWMAKMHFLGLGMDENKEKAIKILNENDLYNSKVLVQQYLNPNNSTEQKSMLIERVIDGVNIKDLYKMTGLEETPNSLFMEGDWKGELLELDWSKSKILRVLPIKMSFQKDDGINEQVTTKITLTDSITNAQGFFSNGNLTFMDFHVPILKQFSDYPNFTHLMTNFQEINLRKLYSHGSSFLLGQLVANYPVWQEKAQPSLIILQKDYSSNKEFKSALEEQEEDFIRLYPNPVKDFYLINFELEHETIVSVEISNYYNTPSYHRTLFNGKKEEGNHLIEILNPPTTIGTYLISIIYDGKKESKILIVN